MTDNGGPQASSLRIANAYAENIICLLKLIIIFKKASIFSYCYVQTEGAFSQLSFLWYNYLYVSLSLYINICQAKQWDVYFKL